MYRAVRSLPLGEDLIVGFQSEPDTASKPSPAIHNRMPVILDESDWPKWLGEEPATEPELLALLRPCPDEWLKIWPVDNKVGNVRNTGRELMLPIDLP
jgi:putative SOS response-associated peptidase YedK